MAHTVHGASNFAALFGKEDEPKEPKTAPLQLPGLLGGRTLHFIRHCQGEHNAMQGHGTGRNTSQYLLDDAKLTAAGEEQARQLLSNPVFLAEDGGKAQLPELVVVSPLRRTMQTAVLGFGAGASFALRPELQETSMMPCDSAKPELGAELLRSPQFAGCGALKGEYEALPKDWHVKGPKWKATVLERFATLLKWLETRPERRVAIVGASGIPRTHAPARPCRPLRACEPCHTRVRLASPPGHHDFLRSNLGESFAPGEVRTYVLEGGLLLGFGSSKEAARRTKMGLRLSGFYRSPSSSMHGSRNNSSVDLAGQLGQLERAPHWTRRFSLGGRSGAGSPRTSNASASNSAVTSPTASRTTSRNASKTDLAGYFSSALSGGGERPTMLRVKLPGRGEPRGGEQSSPRSPPALREAERDAGATHEHTGNDDDDDLSDVLAALPMTRMARSGL